MAQKIFNIIIITTSCLIICFLCGTFFLGTEEAFAELKQDLVGNFVLRAFGGVILGLSTLIPLLIGNLVFNSRLESEQRTHIGRILMISILATSGAAILGTFFFFGR